MYNACSSHGSTLSFLLLYLLPPLPVASSSDSVLHVTSSNPVSSSSSVLQRASADAQYRVVGEAEDLSGAALWLHGRGSERPRGDWPRGVWLRQQDGAQAHGPDHGCQGDLLIDTPHLSLTHPGQQWIYLCHATKPSCCSFIQFMEKLILNLRKPHYTL